MGPHNRPHGVCPQIPTVQIRQNSGSLRGEVVEQASCPSPTRALETARLLLYVRAFPLVPTCTDDTVAHDERLACSGRRDVAEDHVRDWVCAQARGSIELYRELGHELLSIRRACGSKEDRRASSFEEDQIIELYRENRASAIDTEAWSVVHGPKIEGIQRASPSNCYTSGMVRGFQRIV